MLNRATKLALLWCSAAIAPSCREVSIWTFLWLSTPLYKLPYNKWHIYVTLSLSAVTSWHVKKFNKWIHSINYQTLSFGWKSELTKDDVNSSKQAIRILSGVAGLSRGNQSLHPISTLAALMASLMAKNAADAKKNGGSPTALDEWMALTFGRPYQFNAHNKRKARVSN